MKHTYDKLTGNICKCTQCTEQRANRLEREVRHRYREQYDASQQWLEKTLDARLAAEQDYAVAIRQRDLLRAKVLQEIRNEDEEDKRLTIEEAMER